jgi:hypothetical protein
MLEIKLLWPRDESEQAHMYVVILSPPLRDAVIRMASELSN